MRSSLVEKPPPAGPPSCMLRHPAIAFHSVEKPFVVIPVESSGVTRMIDVNPLEFVPPAQDLLLDYRRSMRQNILDDATAKHEAGVPISPVLLAPPTSAGRRSGQDTAAGLVNCSRCSKLLRHKKITGPRGVMREFPYC